MAPAYDFIIIGGGTAGLVLASRLSDDPSQRVLVLEAGPDCIDDARVKIPALYDGLKANETCWNFETSSQNNMNNRQIKIDQGKLLGGSSAINAQVFVSPTKSVIDAWESLGNLGWNWETLQGYFYRAFTLPPIDDEVTKMSLGIDKWADVNLFANGPIKTSFSGDVKNPIRRAWVETFASQGLRMDKDPFFNSSVGVGGFSNLSSVDSTTKERSYSASAYYIPIKNRENLTIVTCAMVEDLVFSVGAPTRIEGVRYRHNNETKSATASKEVILSAGVFNSPKILELSGIGDANLLKSHEIPVIADLPGVGENLQDHLVCSMSFATIDDLKTLDPLIRQEPDAISQALGDYATSKTGLLTSCGIATCAYLPLIGLSDSQQAALQTLLEQHAPPRHDQFRGAYDMIEKAILSSDEPCGTYISVNGQGVLPVDPDSDSPTGPVPGKWNDLAIFLSRPLSRGHAHIQSKDPKAHPVINPKYLSHPADLEVFAYHMMYIQTIAASQPLTSLFKQPLQRRDPASNLADLEAAKKYVKRSAISIWHPCGTCAMLPREKGGVVDTQLKVYGVENLRVVDASVIPLIPNTNIQATVYAIAERAADLIKAEHGLK
ncbi:aryl-alcohol dehydrogenase [Xylaria cf. heliscus]|nr:aryl-alcohol dehydrogenase [Xylaria cf. heliscus]